MAQIVKLRRSSVSGQKPTNSNLQLGELALNTTDGKVYMAVSGSLGPSVEELIVSNAQNTGSISITGAITSSFVSSSFIGDGSDLYNLTITGLTNTLSYFGPDNQLTSSYFANITNNGGTLSLGTNAYNINEPERLLVDNFNSYNIATFQTSQQDTYAEVNIKNFGSGSNSSADLVIWNDSSTEEVSFLDLGLNSSNYSGGQVGYGNDGYLFNAANDLYVGSISTGEHGHLHLFGGNLWDSSSISIYNDGTIGFNTDKFDNSSQTIPSSGDGYAVEISGSVKFDNDVDIVGSITASFFVGDGSGLTNLPAGASVLNISGSDGQNTTIDLLNSFLAITGSGMVTASIISGSLDINVPYIQNGVSAIYIADHGTLQGTASYFDFSGDGVSATVNDGTASIVVSGGTGNGALSDGTYKELVVLTPSTTWAFSHGMGQRYPIFQVFDTLGNVIIPSQIETVDSESAVIRFSSPQAGRVIASLGTGPGGLSQFVSSSATWSINHNLGTEYPMVTIWDTNKNIIFPDRVHSVDNNNVQIFFSVAKTGYANIVKGGHIISGSVQATAIDFANSGIVSGSQQVAEYGYAITGSNRFVGSQTITGSLIIRNAKIDSTTLTLGTGNHTIFDLGDFNGANIDYVVMSGSNMRMGNMMSVWDGSVSRVTETSTTDIGSTTPVTFNVTGAGLLKTQITNGTWTIEILYRALGNSGVNNPDFPATPTPTPTHTPTHTPTASSSGIYPTPTVTPTYTPTPTPSGFSSPTPTPTPTTSNAYISIGTTDTVNGSSCSVIGTSPEIFLDQTDHNLFVSNGNCLSDGVNTVSTIRDASGSPLAGTFYIVWYGGSCSTTTFKSTYGVLSINPTQC